MAASKKGSQTRVTKVSTEVEKSARNDSNALNIGLVVKAGQEKIKGTGSMFKSQKDEEALIPISKASEIKGNISSQLHDRSSVDACVNKLNKDLLIQGP